MYRGKLKTFYQEPSFSIENPVTTKSIRPKVISKLGWADRIVFMLAKAGWYNGNPSAIYSAPFDEVMNAFYYEQMIRQYEEKSIELNREQK